MVDRPIKIGDLYRAGDLVPGMCVYDNQQHLHWLERWPRVVKVEPISVGRVAVTTTGRFYVFNQHHLVLARVDL